MSKKNELPFNHKLFYLDLTTNLALKQKIETCVKKLGGTVETFLDRKDWPVIKKSNDSTTKVNSDKKDDDNRIELMNNLTSRGKMLANKTPNSSINKTKDVLETALRLNIKILTHRSILDFCKKYIKESIDEQHTNEQLIQLNQQQTIQQQYHNHPNSLQQNQSLALDNQSLQQQQLFLSNSNVKVKIKQLKSPFLKFEDKDEKFSPCYKEFDIWPIVCLNNNNKKNSSNQQQQMAKNINTTSKLMQPLQKKDNVFSFVRYVVKNLQI